MEKLGKRSVAFVEGSTAGNYDCRSCKRVSISFTTISYPFHFRQSWLQSQVDLELTHLKVHSSYVQSTFVSNKNTNNDEVN